MPQLPFTSSWYLLLSAPSPEAATIPLGINQPHSQVKLSMGDLALIFGVEV